MKRTPLFFLIPCLFACNGPSEPKTSPPPDSPSVAKPASAVATSLSSITNPVPPAPGPDTSVHKVDTPSTPMVASKWMGSWMDEDDFSGGSLNISAIKNHQFLFSMEVTDGGASGSLEGAAKLDGYHAHYIKKEYGGACRIDFTYYGDRVYVDQMEGNCEAGAGVYYSGDYYARSRKQKEKTLVTLGVLSTAAQDKKFRQLVGDDYQLFVRSSQLVMNGIDMDSLHAVVHQSAVKHMFTERENIVLVNDRMDIWAAVIDEDSIKYFTTREDYRNKLPKTIDDWRQKMEDKKLIFK
jgi:hypothetical protein